MAFDTSDIPDANKGGNCFEVALELMMSLGETTDALLVHGGCVGRGGIEGVPFAHAWVELNGRAIDETVPVEMPVESFYELGQVSVTHKYTFRQMLEKVLEFETYGPWEDDLLSDRYASIGTADVTVPKFSDEWEKTQEGELTRYSYDVGGTEAWILGRYDGYDFYCDSYGIGDGSIEVGKTVGSFCDISNALMGKPEDSDYDMWKGEFMMGNKKAWEQTRDNVVTYGYDVIRGHTPEGFLISMIEHGDDMTFDQWRVQVFDDDDRSHLLMDELFDTEDEAFALIDDLESGAVSFKPATWAKKHESSCEKKAWEQVQDNAFWNSEKLLVTGYTPEGFLITMMENQHDDESTQWRVQVFEDDEFNGLMMDELFDTDDEALEVIEGLESGAISLHPAVWGEHTSSHKFAMVAADLANDIIEDMKADAPFESLEEAQSYVYDDIASSMIYDDDIFDMAKNYVDANELFDQFSDQLDEDVFGAIGDLSRFVFVTPEGGRKQADADPAVFTCDNGDGTVFVSVWEEHDGTFPCTLDFEDAIDRDGDINVKEDGGSDASEIGKWVIDTLRSFGIVPEFTASDVEQAIAPQIESRIHYAGIDKDAQESSGTWRCDEDGCEGTFTLDELRGIYDTDIEHDDDAPDGAGFSHFEDWLAEMERMGIYIRESGRKGAIMNKKAQNDEPASIEWQGDTAYYCINVWPADEDGYYDVECTCDPIDGDESFDESDSIKGDAMDIVDWAMNAMMGNESESDGLDVAADFDDESAVESDLEDAMKEKFASRKDAGKKVAAEHGEDDLDFIGQLRDDLEEAGYDVETFEDAGLMTNNLGLVIDGKQFEWLGSF
jgi:hypothetical protein